MNIDMDAEELLKTRSELFDELMKKHEERIYFEYYRKRFGSDQEKLEHANEQISVINKSIADLEETIVNIDYLTDGSLFEQK
jgi:hypothetical protein